MPIISDVTLSDTITVMWSTYGFSQAKVVTGTGDGVTSSTPTQFARTFDAVEPVVKGLDDIETILRRLLLNKASYVIRGHLIDGPKAKGILRRLHAKLDPPEPATITDVPRRWLALDLDKVSLPEGTDRVDLQACADAAFTLLPPEFQGCDCIVQASGSHGIKPGARLRLWFWLSRHVWGHELKVWLRDKTVFDAAVFSAAEPIFTAAPDFEKGAAEHLPSRILRLYGDEQVQVPSIPVPVIQVSSSSPMASMEDITSALSVIPNEDRNWEAFNRLCMATWRATGGSLEGLDVFKKWSEKHEAHDETMCESRWAHYGSSPPTEIGVGTLIHLAHQADTEWVQPSHIIPSDGSDFGEPDIRPEGFDFEPKAEVDAMIQEYNKKYCVVNENGRALVYEPLPIEGSRHVSYDNSMTFEDFIKLRRNEFVMVAPKGNDPDALPVRKAAAIVWLEHKKRRQFTRGVTFDPSGQPSPYGVLNLWQGFTVSPREGNWSRLRAHIKDVICSGVVEHFEYLLNWIARLVQKPAERGEVAVVMRGDEGAGKGTLANALVEIFGKHSKHISDPGHLVGRFNGHLRDCVFLFADEAFFAGDKARTGVLKAVITEPTLTFEAKNRNATTSKNHIHIMMASNDDWVVPAGKESRRYFVLDVSPKQIGKWSYFSAIAEEMENGGYEAMLHDLMKMDISAFQARNFPVTDALRKQREQSLPAVERWLQDVLSRGWTDHTTCRWDDEVSTDALYASYTDFVKHQPFDRKVVSRVSFGATLSNRMNFRHLRLTGDSRAVRPWGYELGSLAKARLAFDTAYDLKTEWPAMPEDPELTVVPKTDDKVVPITAAQKVKVNTDVQMDFDLLTLEAN